MTASRVFRKLLFPLSGLTIGLASAVIDGPGFGASFFIGMAAITLGFISGVNAAESP